MARESFSNSYIVLRTKNTPSKKGRPGKMPGHFGRRNCSTLILADQSRNVKFLIEKFLKGGCSCV
jgi:hypothetical protein